MVSVAKVPDFIRSELAKRGLAFLGTEVDGTGHDRVLFRFPNGGTGKWSLPREGHSCPRAMKNNQSQFRHYLTRMLSMAEARKAA
ncbi:MAG TPA: hypothetical protein VKR31_04015 [Rhizomicrobium sp.]|nr:hypothetical protein [Rhizomicrobium sp.]